MTDRSAGVGEFEARLADDGNASVFVRLTAGHLLIEDADRGPIHDVHVDDIEEVVQRGPRIEIALRRASPLVLECQRPEQLDAALMAACCTIPELTRALRSQAAARSVSSSPRCSRRGVAPRNRWGARASCEPSIPIG